MKENFKGKCQLAYSKNAEAFFPHKFLAFLVLTKIS